MADSWRKYDFMFIHAPCVMMPVLRADYAVMAMRASCPAGMSASKAAAVSRPSPLSRRRMHRRRCAPPNAVTPRDAPPAVCELRRAIALRSASTRLRHAPRRRLPPRRLRVFQRARSVSVAIIFHAAERPVYSRATPFACRRHDAPPPPTPPMLFDLPTPLRIAAHARQRQHRRCA